ncbi:hypothetical protein D9M69_493800 [compost metagenome]
MFGAVHLIQAVVVDFIHIDSSEVVFAVRIVAIVPIVLSSNRRSDVSDLLMHVRKATGSNHPAVAATAFGAKLVIKMTYARVFVT